MTSHDAVHEALSDRAVRELAAATAALVSDHDVIGTITNVLAGCIEAPAWTVSPPGGRSPSPADLATRTRAALEERTVIERAKGVLAYSEDLPMDAAFDRLVALAREQAQPLTVMAAAVVEEAVSGRRRG